MAWQWFHGDHILIVIPCQARRKERSKYWNSLLILIWRKNLRFKLVCFGKEDLPTKVSWHDTAKGGSTHFHMQHNHLKLNCFEGKSTTQDKSSHHRWQWDEADCVCIIESRWKRKFQIPSYVQRSCLARIFP